MMIGLPVRRDGPTLPIIRCWLRVREGINVGVKDTHDWEVPGHDADNNTKRSVSSDGLLLFGLLDDLLLELLACLCEGLEPGDTCGNLTNSELILVSISLNLSLKKCTHWLSLLHCQQLRKVG